MKVKRSIKGGIIICTNSHLYWSEFIDGTYNGHLFFYDLNTDVESSFDELYNFSTIVNYDNFLLFQTNDFNKIAILDLSSIHIKHINSSGLNLSRCDYKGLPKMRASDSKESFFIDVLEGKIVKTTNELPSYRIWNSSIGIYTAYSTICCNTLNDGTELWKVNCGDLNYDRGGHHYAALTPKNDVPHQCLFHYQLLLALFCTHTAAIDLQTGRVVWEHNIGSEHRYWYHQGRLVLMQGAYIYELCPDTGAVLRENVPFLQAAQLPLVGRKTNMVGNHERIYFCLAEQKEIVTLDAATLQIFAINKIEHNKEAVLLPPEKIYLSNNKLFVTLQCQKPTVHNEILVYEV